jgi:hypothetical protein
MTSAPKHPASTQWLDDLYDLTFDWLDRYIDGWLKRVGISYGDQRVVVPRWMILMALIGLMMAFG